MDQGSDDAIIGDICYRTFKEQRFAEIAFCAVHATHQVKGYGTKVMNLLKQTAARQGIEFFITYADNYAIGYFKKQGFYVYPSIYYYHIPELIVGGNHISTTTAAVDRIYHITAVVDR